MSRASLPPKRSDGRSARDSARSKTRLGRSKRNRRMTLRAARPVTQVLGPVARQVLSWSAVVLTIVGAAIGLRYGWEALRDYEKLRVKRIEVTGATRATSGEVVTYAGIRLGDAILGLDLDAVARSVKRHPWIDEVVIKRRLPDQVVVEVIEQDPKLLVALGDVYVANARGEVFKRVSGKDGVALPVLTGIDRELATRDPDALSARVREAIELATNVERSAAQLGRVDELHWDDALGWSIVALPQAVRALPVTVHLGRHPMAQLEVALAAFLGARELGQQPIIVWADGGQNSSFVQVRIGQASGSETLIASRGE